MGTAEEDQDLRGLGKLMFFLSVGLFSALCLAGAVHFFREEEPWIAGASLAASASLWWPLFRLGRYHAKQRRRPQA
jgi:hypothetical protein